MSESAILTVNGMKCGGCEANVTGKVSALPGVVSVTASHQNNQVSVEFDPEQTSLETISQSIQQAGYSIG
ncbi:MAG: mercuric reductase [Methylobacter sp.]|nr:MAG: mercuric reductase [Methylobacter sp.]PPD04649.1 MAG: mercuric reductase [Methylobacter sp.]PPD23633.1 MAG: mercuric reductase [Methylobacter sp.]PPD37478.1 MAG: mercuric reductase [Methylomonas sp.]